MPPVVAAVVKTAFVFFTRTVVGSLVGKALLAVGAGLAMRALAPKPDLGYPRGRELQLSYDPSIAREIVVGRSAVGGSIVYENTTGAENKYRWIVVALSDVPITGFVGLRYGDESVTLSGDPTTGFATVTSHFTTDAGSPKVSVRVHLGSYAPTVDADLDAAFAEIGASFKGVGVAYAIIKAEWHDEAYLSGEPVFSYIVDGAAVYDPRLDSTVPGGSGDQRVDDPSTWAYSANPALIAAQYCRGWKTGSRVVVGLGARAEDIPTAELIEAANDCDESIALDGGGTEPRYACGGVISTSQDGAGVIDRLMSACDGAYVQRGGSIVFLPGVPRTSVYTFTDDDLLALEATEVNFRRSVSEITNAVTGRYQSPDEGYDLVAFDPFEDADAISSDAGVRHERSIELDMVTSRTQARRIAKRTLAQSRREVSATIALPLWAIEAEPGDVVTWESELYGWARAFKIADQSLALARNDGETVMVSMALEETDADVDAWTPADDEGTGVTGGVTRPAPAPNPADPAGLTVTPTTLENDAGGQYPAITITWTPPDDAARLTTVVEMSPAGLSDWSVVKIVATSVGKTIVSDGLVPGGTYDVAVSHRHNRGGASARIVAAGVTAPAVMTAYAVAPGSDLSDALDALDAAETALADRVEVVESASIVNLLEDPEFTLSSVHDWALSSASAYPVIDGESSPRALIVRDTASGAGEALVVTWPGEHAIAAGGVIDASATITLSGVATSAALRARWYTAAGAVIQADDLDAGSSGRVGGVAVAPATAASVRIEAAVTVSGAGDWSLGIAEPMVAYGVHGQSAPAAYLGSGGELTSAIERAQVALSDLAASLEVTRYRSAEAEADIRTLEQIVSDGQGITAQIISALSARVGGTEASVTTISEAVATLEGYARARFAIETGVPGADAFLSLYAEDTGGAAYSSVGLGADVIALYNRIAGAFVSVLELVDGAAHFSGPVYIGGLSIVIDPDLPGITFTAGATSLAIGAGIGQAGAYLMWCGPSSIADADRTSAGAVFSIGIDGSAYFGGGLTAGALESKSYSSATAAGSEATIGPFSTLGGPIVVVWGGSLQHSGKRSGIQSYSGSPEVTLKLWRKEGTGAKTLVGTQTFSLVMTSFLYEGETDETYFYSSGSSSATYTDSAGGTAERTYWVEFDDYSLFTIPGTPGTDFFHPSYGANCVEE